MEFKISNTQVYGMEYAYKASGNPMRPLFDREAITEKDQKRAINLASTKGGEGHDNFLKGIIVQMDLIAPLYFWKQAQRYHWFDFISSQSTMHSLMKFDVKTQCVAATNGQVLEILNQLIKDYLLIPETDPEKGRHWQEIIASLPSGFCLGASMTTNYQQLKTMYFQRRHHKLKEWHEFCAWCETLPDFKKLLGLEE